MTRVTEFTPLLVPNDEPYNVRPRRRSAWQYVLVGALGLGVLSLFHQRQPIYSPPVNVEDVIVSFNTPTANDVDDVAFLSSMEAFKDPSVDPCVDFYEYACGGWLKTHEIPSDRPSIDSSFYVVSETNKETIKKIFDQNPPQIGQFYHSCLNDQEVDAEAVHFVSQLIENVHQVNSTEALMALAGEMDQSLGISTFFSLFVGADPEDPSINVVQLSQGGLTLPSREYYLEESKVDAYAALYVDYVTKLFAVEGLDSHNVTEYAEAVLETETAFAKISLSNAALRDPWTTNKAYPFAEIATRYPFLMAYLNGIYKLEPFPMLHAIVATPDFFEAQNELLSDESLLPQLKNYLSFHLIDSFGAVLGEYFRRASHEFHGKIQGAGALLPRDQFCVRLTTAFLGDELGKYYMEDVFGLDAKAAAQALVAEIEESLKALLLTEAWLDKVTYDAAVEKLIKVKNYIGGPDDVPPLPFELQADAFFNNVKSLMQLSAAGTIQSINQPVDEQAWDMFPSTVNAYYDPSANKMVFPAAILQPPFYSAEHFPAAANFARIGMVMGHELSHGFDDQGRNYDGNGALRSWWTPSVSAEFSEKAQCLAAQYSSFPVVSIEDGHVLGMVNGNLTLGENIADNGGIHLAYEAYHLWKSTFAPPVPIETPSPPVEPKESSSPVVPIPDVPVPEPTETGEVPVVTSPPALPVPEAETLEPVQTEPNGEIPVATPSQSTVIPEPEPTNVGPGEVIPEPAPEQPVPTEHSPAPTESNPPTEAPVETVPSAPPVIPDVPETPTPPNVPDIPTPPETPPVVPDVPSTPTPPNVPGIPTPPVTALPPVIVPQQPDQATETPSHKKKKEEPTDKEHVRKHRKDEFKKDKSESSEDGNSHKHGEKKGDDKKLQGSKHDHDKREEKDDKEKDDSDEKKEDRHHHEKESGSKDGDSKKHNKHTDGSKADGEPSSHHDKAKDSHEDDNERDSGRKHHHGKEEDEGKLEHRREEDEDYNRKHRHHDKREEEGERDHKEDKEKREHRHEEDEEHDRKHRHHEKREEEEDHHKHGDREFEGRHERREEHHHHDEERDENEENVRHKHKHRGHDECDDCEYEERHGKRNYRWDEDEWKNDSHKHHKHGKKEEKRERKERKQQRKADEVFEGKHHHRWDYDDEGYGDDGEWRHHHKHHHHEEERWECGDCHREHKHHHHKHHRHEEESEERWECGDCGQERKHHHHKHNEDWDKEWKYPFSGGDVKIHSMIEKLARAIAQPNDPVADDRLFFTAFAQNWCEKRTPGYTELLRTIDPHSPGKWRVNGPLMNYDKFAEVFSCPVGTPMNPEKKCVIW